MTNENVLVWNEKLLVAHEKLQLPNETFLVPNANVDPRHVKFCVAHEKRSVAIGSARAPGGGEVAE